MANFKDNNADLGNQTIEGTEPPIALDAEIVMPDGSTRPIPTAAELDAQLEALMAEPVGASDPTVIAMPTQDDATAQAMTDDLDAQLAALMAEPDATPNDHSATLDDINAQIDAILNSTVAEPEPEPEQSFIVTEPIESTVTTETATETETETVQTTVAEQNIIEQPDEQPIIIAPPVTEQPPVVEQPTAAEQPQAPEQPPVQQAQAQAQDNAAAREMLEQARLIMEQAQLAQQAAQQAAQSARQAATQNTQPQTPPQQHAPQYGATDPTAQSIIQQAQMMLQQAQQAQLQAQQAAQAAQMQAQVVQATTRTATPPPVTTPDSYAVKEVDRLKNELDGMRELVNKLTFTLAQMPNGAQQVAQMPPHYAYGGGDQEQYRKLQSELEGMRREIIEKDLRDREKELERKQKEAENTVKDIRPEMVQMSDSRDVAPLGGSGAFGSEFIPLANGVFYSIRDKQVYVMTPASNAAAASPTIEPPKPQAAAPRPAPARTRPRPAAKKRPVMHRRPGMPPRRRPGSPSRRPSGR